MFPVAFLSNVFSGALNQVNKYIVNLSDIVQLKNKDLFNKTYRTKKQSFNSSNHKSLIKVIKKSLKSIDLIFLCLTEYMQLNIISIPKGEQHADY